MEWLRSGGEFVASSNASNTRTSLLFVPHSSKISDVSPNDSPNSIQRLISSAVNNQSIKSWQTSTV